MHVGLYKATIVEMFFHVEKNPTTVPNSKSGNAEEEWFMVIQS